MQDSRYDLYTSLEVIRGTHTILKIHSEKIGQGTPIVLMLHGWNRSGQDLKSLGELVAAHAEVHLLDLPGFGQTPPPPIEGWDTSQYAELVTEYIQALGSSGVVLLGHSFGGRVSLRIAAKHPELVQSIILVDSHGLRPIRTLYQNLRVFAIKRAAKLVKMVDALFGTKIFPEKFAKKFGSPDYQNAGILKNTFVKTVSEDQSEDVRNVAARTLLLWGSEDKETPVAMAKKFHELLVNSKLIIMEGKGHSPFHGMGASLCANYIIPFLEEEA